MATVAGGLKCPQDETLVTCVGQVGDDTLVGNCPFCKTQYEMAAPHRAYENPKGIPPGTQVPYGVTPHGYDPTANLTAPEPDTVSSASAAVKVTPAASKEA